MNFPDYMEPRLGEILATEMDTASKNNMWAVILGLEPVKDGNQWSFLWGDNVQEGVCGFGDTPFDAMSDFEKNMYQKISDKQVGV